MSLTSTSAWYSRPSATAKPVSATASTSSRLRVCSLALHGLAGLRGGERIQHLRHQRLPFEGGKRVGKADDQRARRHVRAALRVQLVIAPPGGLGALIEFHAAATGFTQGDQLLVGQVGIGLADQRAGEVHPRDGRVALRGGLPGCFLSAGLLRDPRPVSLRDDFSSSAVSSTTISSAASATSSTMAFRGLHPQRLPRLLSSSAVFIRGRFLRLRPQQ